MSFKKPKLKVSASRLKTFQACSWLYHCKYVLKIADPPNAGAQKGTICHLIFECLAKKRRHHRVGKIISDESITNSPSIVSLVKKHMKLFGVPEESFQQIDEMIMVGLKTDFLCEGGELKEPEYEFTIESDNPRYIINGLIDKMAVYQNKWIRISDYKSSKKKFAELELTNNVQSLMYCLAAKHIWPKLKPIVDFIFLQYPEEPLQRPKISDDKIEGFRLYLADVYKKMENFTLQDAQSNLAANKPLPKSGEGFCGPLMCGWAGRSGFVQSPDQKKKDGSPAYYCSMKFPFDYWSLCDESGAVLKSSKEKSDLIADESKGQFIIPKKYLGCPKFR